MRLCSIYAFITNKEITFHIESYISMTVNELESVPVPITGVSQTQRVICHFSLNSHSYKCYITNNNNHHLKS